MNFSLGLLQKSANWGAQAEVLRIRASLTLNECDQIHMTGTLQRVIEASHIAIAAIPYDLAWGEVDSAEDLLAYQEADATGTIK